MIKTALKGFDEVDGRLYSAIFLGHIWFHVLQSEFIAGIHSCAFIVEVKLGINADVV